MVNYNTQCVIPHRQIKPKQQQLGYNQCSSQARSSPAAAQKDASKPPAQKIAPGSIKSIVDVGLVQLKTVPSAVHVNRPIPVPRAVNIYEELDVDWCQHCGLPLGSCRVSSGDVVLHKECAAECILKFEKEEDEAAQAADAALKRSKRTDYDIGWKVERIPRNLSLAAKLGGDPNPHGMWCLKFTKWNNKAVLVPTLDPSAAVNLEYLAIALKVRKDEGREPLFSLDPLFAGSDLKNGWQVKRFEPAWLAGTSVGEVMFQADVYLKEVSMGEYPQPVAGMKSAFEFAEAETSRDTWLAREWFMVRKASVRTTDGILIPDVELGVEAREQVKGSNSLDDVPVTRPDLPLAKYADSFTRYFDLIAERKSVVYNLREVARACILAKFLVDRDTQLVDDNWPSFVDDVCACTSEACCLEIPQLWCERRYSDVHVEGGHLADNDKNPKQLNVLGVYGGVNLGMDKPQEAAPKAAAAPPQKHPAEAIKVVPHNETDLYGMGAVAKPMVIAGEAGGPSLSGMSAGDVVKAMAPTAVRGMKDALLGVAMSAEGSAVVPFSEYTKAAPPRFLKAPKGVDLNLNMFDLSASARDADSAAEDGSWAVTLKAHDNEAVGHTFWADIQADSQSSIDDSDKALLLRVFNPCLSDRREEHDLFKPPEVGARYVRRLRRLVCEELEMRDLRRSVFLGANFDTGKPGPAFPSSWASTHRVTGVQTSSMPPSSSLYSWPEYLEEATNFSNVLKLSIPVFDKTTEDGVRFRVYQVGTLQVRTLTEHLGEEVVGAVFSTQSPSAQSATSNDRCIGRQEAVARVTQYVDAARGSSSVPRFYVVIKTQTGNCILTEKRLDGTVTWQENPRDLEARNALAKTTFSTERLAAGTTVGKLKAYQESDVRRPRCSLSDVKSYADGVFGVMAAA